MKKPIVVSAVFSALSLLAPLAKGAVVMEWDFDANDGGWVASGTGAVTVANGFLTATASGNDPQLNLGGAIQFFAEWD